jgi:tetratricopeptide (TPR) repeat protein
MLKTYLRNEEWKDTQTLLRKTLVKASGNARVHALAGAMRLQQAEFYGAEREFLRALEIYPDYPAAGVGLASTHLALGRMAEAVQRLNSLEGRSGALETRRLRELARAYFAMQDFTSSARSYEAAISLAPADARLLRELGILYLRYLDQPGRGKPLIERSLQINPAQENADELRRLLAPG